MAIGRMKVHATIDHIVLVKGHGNDQILTCINGEWELRVLKDVLHVPFLGNNLFFIVILTYKGTNITYDKLGCTMHTNMKIIMQGALKNTMY
jgi:hypothetical protein